MSYSYDRTPFENKSIQPFLDLVKVREEHIAAGREVIPKADYNANYLAASLHPVIQHVLIDKVTDHGDAKSFRLVPDPSRGTRKMAYFRAGQYVTVPLNIGSAFISKPYTIRSNPADALGTEDTSYTLTIKSSKTGYASKYILDNWKEGDAVDISGPLGSFYYQRARDAHDVIALAGGSAITPFYSMAAAIVDGIENFNLTILYGSRTADGILLKNELADLEKRSGGKVRVIHVLSDDDTEGYEHGFLTAELVKKYAPEGTYSVFMCGPAGMYAFEEEEMKKLGLRRRYIREEVPGDYTDPGKNADYPHEADGKTFRLNVKIGDETHTIDAKAGVSLLRSMEFAGIKAPSHCRSGSCGWCHSKLLSGNVYIPEDADGRRAMDEKFGWIHPCATFPLSDITLEVYPVNGL